MERAEQWRGGRRKVTVEVKQTLRRLLRVNPDLTLRDLQEIAASDNPVEAAARIRLQFQQQLQRGRTQPLLVLTQLRLADSQHFSKLPLRMIKTSNLPDSTPNRLNPYPGGDIPKLWEESFGIENRVHARVTSQGCLFRLGLVPSGVGCLSCYLATLFWCRPFPSGLSADLPALAAETGKQCSHAFGQATTFLGLAHGQQSSRARRPHASY